MSTEALPEQIVLADLPAERVTFMRGFLVACIALIVAGELTIWAGAEIVGLGLEALAVAILAGARWWFAPGGIEEPPSEFGYACAGIALLPIMRLLSVTMATKHVSEIVWYLLIGLPMLVVLVRLIGRQPHLRPLLRLSYNGLSQGIIALCGIPLGLLGYMIARPERLAGGSIFENALVALIVLTVFSGLVEEMLFRGVLTDALERFFGPLQAIAGASVIFAVFTLTAGGAGFAIFALSYGLMFGLIARRTGTLIGIAVAHGLLNTGLIIVWPAVWG